MSIDTAIERFRRRQASLFRDECIVTRASEDEPTLNEGTGELEEAVPTTIYEGPCLVRSYSWEGSDTQVGEKEVRFQGARAKLPINTAIEKDDVLTVTASTHDANLVGHEFRVTDVFHDGWQIVRQVILEEVT